LDESGAEDASVAGDLQKLPSVPKLDSDCESISTATSRTDNLLINWLQESLKLVVKDHSVVESLAVCAELVLYDESTVAEERLQSTLDMLRAEGIPEDVLLEFACHIADDLGIGSM